MLPVSLMAVSAIPSRHVATVHGTPPPRIRSRRHPVHPTVFIAYTGESLDYKAPLLKALSAVNKAAVDVCHYFNPEVKKVMAYLGWEQEYF